MGRGRGAVEVSDAENISRAALGVAVEAAGADRAVVRRRAGGRAATAGLGGGGVAAARLGSGRVAAARSR